MPASHTTILAPGDITANVYMPKNFRIHMLGLYKVKVKVKFTL